ncbi:MAG: hypothetical protein ACE5FY_01140 [Nitrospiria bacterium]
MPEKTIKKQEISPRNTKAELLAAYKGLLEQVNLREKEGLDPEKKSQKKKKEDTLSEAKSITSEGVVKGVRNVQNEINTLLTHLSDRLSAEVGKLKKIEETIQIREEELKEIYEIDKSAATLAALIESQHKKKDTFEVEMKEKKELLLQEIADTRKKWQLEQDQYLAAVKEAKETEKKKREREKEEFQYAHNREIQLAKDRFADELTVLQAEKEAVKKETLELNEQSELLFSKRENDIKIKEEEFKTLQEKVENFPLELEKAVTKAMKAVTDKITLEYEYKEKLLRQTFEGEKNVLKTQIDSLEKTVEEQSEKMARLSDLQEIAYQKVQDVAVRAIEGASHSASYNGLQKLLRDQGSNTGSDKSS